MLTVTFFRTSVLAAIQGFSIIVLTKRFLPILEEQGDSLMIDAGQSWKKFEGNALDAAMDLLRLESCSSSLLVIDAPSAVVVN